MEIITCASYYGSGSSAVTDFASEFSDVKSYTADEFRFVQDPDGISDLEYNLVQNFNRHNSGHAVKKYLELVKRNKGNILSKKYGAILGDKWTNESRNYVNELVDFSFKGWWQYDLIDKGYFFYFRKRIINKLLRLTLWRRNPERSYNSMKNEITYCSHPSEQKFLQSTRKYIDSLFYSDSKGIDKVVVDQLVPPSNLPRYVRYFNDIKIIVVDRDPRDVFLLEKYIWKDGVIPTDVKTFCEWFVYTREDGYPRNEKPNLVKRIMFEDMVYHYNEISKELEQWLKLDERNHTNAKEAFNPSESIKNTKLWERLPVNQEEIKYIENALPKYLYKY